MKNSIFREKMANHLINNKNYKALSDKHIFTLLIEQEGNDNWGKTSAL